MSRDQAAAGETAALRWQAHLFRARPLRSALVVSTVAAGVFAVHLAFGQAVLTGMAAVLVIGALSQFFFPLNYRLTARGVEVRQLGFFAEAAEWGDLAGYRDCGDCLVLARRRGRWRKGFMLHFGANAEQVVRLVAAHLPELDPPGPKKPGDG